MGHPSFVGWNDADNSTRWNTMVIKYIETTAVGIYYIFIILFALLQYLYDLSNTRSFFLSWSAMHFFVTSDYSVSTNCDFNISHFLFRRFRKKLPVWKQDDLFHCRMHLQKLLNSFENTQFLVLCHKTCHLLLVIFLHERNLH